MSDQQSYQGTRYKLIGNLSNQPVIVFIHGVGLNQSLWDSWVPVLENDFCVLTLDLLGHGNSDNPPGPRSIKDFSDQVLELVNYLNIDKFALAGFSLGAVIGQVFASLHTSRLTHLVLLHSVYQRSEQQCSSVRERYQITKEQGPMATVEIAIERWFSEPYRLENPDKMNDLRDIFAAHVDDGYLKAYYLFGHAEPEMEDYTLAHVVCPSLVITGSDDVGSTPAMSEALARDLVNSELIINPGHRHMSPAEFSDIMASQVLKFLKR